jgi:NAD(P)-dependent dehydrogenase (short-subunit alcohol dehydrogenase family)
VTAPERLVPVGFVDRLFRLDGQVALVTGGASGLGAAIAAGLGQAGARVVIADLDLAGAEAYAALLTDLAERPVALPVDVTRRDSVETLVAAVVERFGRIDVLVQSAGTAARHPAETFPEEAWDRVVAVNLKGAFLVAQAVGREMLRQRAGAIVNIASIGASIAYPHTTAYLQSKGGVAQLTRSLALEGSTGASGSTRSRRRSSTRRSSARRTRARARRASSSWPGPRSAAWGSRARSWARPSSSRRPPPRW